MDLVGRPQHGGDADAGAPLVDIYSLGGMVFVMTIYRYAVPYVVVLPAMKKVNQTGGKEGAGEHHLGGVDHAGGDALVPEHRQVVAQA